MVWFGRRKPVHPENVRTGDKSGPYSTLTREALTELPPMSATPQLLGFRYLMTLGVSEALHVYAQGAIGHDVGFALRLDGSVTKWRSRMTAVSASEAEPVRFVTSHLPALQGSVMLRGGSVQLGSTSPYFAVKADGSVWVWTATYDGTPEAPTRISELVNVTDLATDYQNSTRLALTDHGDVYAWGSGYGGNLGDGTIRASQQTPTRIRGLNNIVAIRNDDDGCYALDIDGAIWAWGLSLFDDDDDIDDERLSPVQIRGLPAMTSLGDGSAAIDSSGSVWTWGRDRQATKLEGMPRIVAVSSWKYGWGGRNGELRTSHAVALDGSVWAWGANAAGQIGDGTTSDHSAPIRVVIPTTVADIVSHQGLRWALGRDGSLWTWGGVGEGEGASPQPHRVNLPKPHEARFFEKWGSL